MSKEIVVIVKNKLMTTDVVLPILIELKEKHNTSSLILVHDELAYKGINENVVIRDAIDYVGRKIYVGGGKHKLFRKIIKLFWLSNLAFKLLTGSKVLHFGIFEVFPYSILGKIFAKNIFMLQGNSFTHSYNRYNKLLGKKAVPYKKHYISKNVVLFNDNDFKGMLDDNCRVYKFGGTRIRPVWMNYVNARSEYYFNKYHSDIDLSNGCIVLILSYFGRLPAMRLPDESLKILLGKTIEVFDSVKGDIPVFIKPHVFTDLNIVDEYIKGKSGYHMTYLHPSVLSTKAKVFVCNTYSITMADANFSGVKTIEYADYSSNLLKISKGKSVGYEYIDEFIINNQGEFKKTLKEILYNSSDKLLRNSSIINGTHTDAEELLIKLSN
jgi:hypothetical protein